jgi:quinol monooxygenase YgiN
MSKDSFRLIVRQTINPGGLEEFKRLAGLGAGNAEAGEPGTLGYEFFIDQEGKECFLNEYYADSESFLTHFANVQPILQASMGVSGLVEAIVLGDPGPEARAALAGLGAKYYSDCIGFCR